MCLTNVEVHQPLLYYFPCISVWLHHLITKRLLLSTLLVWCNLASFILDDFPLVFPTLLNWSEVVSFLWNKNEPWQKILRKPGFIYASCFIYISVHPMTRKTILTPELRMFILITGNIKWRYAFIAFVTPSLIGYLKFQCVRHTRSILWFPMMFIQPIEMH
jgi:hypothetical protein